ncbi:MAG: hypothetical protein RJA49_1444, partial [Actinomycetota bacterium]
VPPVAPAVPLVAPLVPPVAPAVPLVGPLVPPVAPAVPLVAPLVPPVAPAVPPVAPAVPPVPPSVPPGPAPGPPLSSPPPAFASPPASPSLSTSAPSPASARFLRLGSSMQPAPTSAHSARPVTMRIRGPEPARARALDGSDCVVLKSVSLNELATVVPRFLGGRTFRVHLGASATLVPRRHRGKTLLNWAQGCLRAAPATKRRSGGGWQLAAPHREPRVTARAACAGRRWAFRRRWRSGASGWSADCPPRRRQRRSD